MMQQVQHSLTNYSSSSSSNNNNNSEVKENGLAVRFTMQ